MLVLAAETAADEAVDKGPTVDLIPFPDTMFDKKNGIKLS